MNPRNTVIDTTYYLINGLVKFAGVVTVGHLAKQGIELARTNPDHQMDEANKDQYGVIASAADMFVAGSSGAQLLYDVFIKNGVTFCRLFTGREALGIIGLGLLGAAGTIYSGVNFYHEQTTVSDSYAAASASFFYTQGSSIANRVEARERAAKERGTLLTEQSENERAPFRMGV